MVSLFEDQLIDDVVTRAEQSRVSYNIQTEEFRNLNANLQTYLNDIKTIDDDNRQLQENIEEIRTNYILSLENHLKRLPFDFRQQSQTLTGAHLERYKSKSRAKRFTNEREELKRRIHFVASNEKEQTKRLNTLQKQERTVRNEFNKLNEQIQNLSNYVENEKQNYCQAMDRVDNLHVQLEEISVERSKTEFEIQTLKEEVKLMQTAKEFLDEERETIIATQTDANEYLLSRLNESINRIREDFHELNQTQLKQTENEYKQMLQILEENFLTNETTTTTHQRVIQTDYERLHNEHQSVLQELTTLKDHNETLSERVFAMETDLHSLHDERMQELITKDNELECTKIELQTLNEKLNNLAEYDRNLKFELTLYRGVLESEYRRKQSTISTQHLIRPTTLRSNNNSMTDRTVWLTSSTNANKLNNQQQEEILTSRPRVQSEYDPLGEDINVQTDDVIPIKTTSSGEKLASGGSLWQQVIEPFSHEPQNDIISITNISQDAEKHSDLPSTTVLGEDQSASPFEVQQPPSQTSATSSAKRNSPASPTSPILREGQSASSQTQRAPITPPELQSLPVIQATTLVSSDLHQPPSILAQENQILSEIQQASSRTSSAVSLDSQSSSVPVVVSEIPEHPLSTSDVQQSPSTPPPQEHQPSSRTSSIGSATPYDIQRSPTSAIASTTPEHQPSTSVVRQSPSTPPQEHQPSSGSTTSSTVLEHLLSTSDDRQLPSLNSSEHQSSRTSSVGSAVLSDIQKFPGSGTAPTVSEDQSSTSVVHQSPSAPTQEHQPSSRTSSVGSAIPYDTGRSPISATAPAITEYPPATSDVPQSPLLYSQEHQSSTSRTSSVGSAVSSDIQRSAAPVTTSAIPDHQPPTSDTQQSPSTPPQEQQPPSRTSSVGSAIPSDIQRPPTSGTAPTVSADQSPTYDARESPFTASTNRAMLSEIKSSPITDASTHEDVQETTSPVVIDDYQTAIVNIGQLGKSFVETTDTTEHEESTPHVTDEQATGEMNPSERHQSIHSMERSSMEEYEISFDTDRDASRSSSFALTSTPLSERKQSFPQSDTNISSVQDHQSQLKQNYSSEQTKTEEEINSSLTIKPEEINLIDNSSSTITNDYQLDDNLYESNPFSLPDTSKQSSHSSSLTDVEDVDASTSQKFEIRSDDSDDPKLAVIMQDLRSVFLELANNEDLVEINNDLPNELLDRLEFHEHIIRTFFDSFLRKYLVQAAAQGNRSTTLDWIEFRDILFPLLAGRCTEQNIRKLFDLFDTSKDGYLSLQEIAELLEVLQASDTIYLAKSIIDEYDTDHDGKLSVDELIEAIKNTDYINENVLSKDTENQEWFNPSPTDIQTITLEVPIINFPSRTDDKFSKGISLLGRIFQKVGANSETKQLDSNNKNLSMQITNEFIINNINISSDDLQLFIQLFLNKKQNTDPLINWIEFRDIFLPIINKGFYSKTNIEQWFDILDKNRNGIITREEVIQLLRLLQIQHPEEIINKLNADNTDQWTLDELTFALDNVDETATHLQTDNEQVRQIASFDINWLSNNVF